jgi:hypothetical protein
MCFILQGELVTENVGMFFCSSSARSSFASVSCLQLSYISPELEVRRPVADICLYPRLINFVEFKFYGS